MIYLIVWLVLLLFLVSERRAKQSFNYWVLLISLLIFSAFRWEVGCDWHGYLHQYRVANDGVTAVGGMFNEPLWWFAIGAIKEAELPYPWINVVSSAVFFAGVHTLAKRQPSPVSFVVLLFPVLILNMPMSAIRQGAAIGLFCFALSAFVDQKLIRFVAFTLLASMVHSSAALFFLLTPLVRGNFSTRSLLLAGVLAVPGIFVILGSDRADLALTRYVETGIDAQGSIFRVFLVFLTALLFFRILRPAWSVLFPHDYKLVIVSAIVMLGTLLLLPLSSVIADRMSYYMLPVQAIILARIPFLRLGANQALWTIAPYVVLSIVLAIWVAFSGLFEVCYLPYQTWLFAYPPTRLGVFYGF